MLMALKNSSYSPNILIYLEIGEKIIRLADVLCETATLYESDYSEVKPNTQAFLVFSVDGVEQRKNIVLHQGISKGASMFFSSEQIEEATLDFDEEKPQGY